MSTRTNLLVAAGVLLLLAMLAVAFLWSNARPRGLVIDSNQRATATREKSELQDQPTPRTTRPPDARSTSGVVTAKTEPKDHPPERQPFDLSCLSEDEVLLRAKVTLTNPGGLKLLYAAERLPSYLLLRYALDGEQTVDAGFPFELDGQVEAACSIWTLPFKEGALQAANWSARIEWGERENFKPISAPKLDGRVLDFGTLEFDLSAFMGEDEWLFVGRMVHATGLPIDEFEGLALEVKSPDWRLWFDPREDGSFACSHWGDFNVDDPLSLVVFEYGDETVRRLPKPKVNGRIVELGDVVLDCAAVEIRLAAWPDANARRARKGLAADAELPYANCWVYFNSFNSSHEANLGEPDTTCVKFMPAGPYRYEASISDTTFAWGEVKGVLDLEQGKLARLDISFVQVHGVWIRLVAPEPLTSIEMYIATLDAEGEVHDSWQWPLQPHDHPFTFANPDRKPLKIVASARGYALVERLVDGATEEVVIEFKERAPVKTGWLVLQLPRMPEFFQNYAPGTDIVVMAATIKDGAKNNRTLGTYSSQARAWGATEAGAMPRFEMPLGPTEVWLQEGTRVWGYPRGIISGPVECTITGEADCIVKVPGFGAPPWSTPAQSSSAQLTCEGQQFNYTGIVLMNGEKQHMLLHWDAYLQLCAASYALPDGDGQAELELKLPQGDERRLILAQDFPARVEVRVRRGKELVPFPISVTVQGFKHGIGIYAQSTANGKLRFWAPLGKTRVSIMVVGSTNSFARDIDVSGELTIIEINDDGSYAYFSWQTSDSQERASAWWLLDAQGDPVSLLGADTKSLKLRPGLYKMMPENRTKPEVEFTVAEASDITVDVPFVPAFDYSGSVLVKYPKELKPSPDGYHLEWLWYVPLSGNPDRDIRLHDFASEWGRERIGADGLKFSGLPLNVEIVLSIAMALSNEDSAITPAAWAIAPMRLKLTSAATETLTVAWKPAAVLDESWYEFGQIHWIGEGDLRYFSWNYIFLPGTYTAKVFVGDSPSTFSVSLKANGELTPMPAEVRRVLGGDDGGD